MKTVKMGFWLVSAMTVALAGCQSDGSKYKANTFDQSQVNSMQEAETVKIITASPANIIIDNSENQKAAQIGGALLGAIAGAALGNTNNNDTAAIGAVAGGAVGAGVGSVVAGGENTVEGVMLAYSKDGKVFTSTQVGKLCEYKIGEISLMVKTKAGETRIQPNATCPPETAKSE